MKEVKKKLEIIKIRFSGEHPKTKIYLNFTKSDKFLSDKNFLVSSDSRCKSFLLGGLKAFGQSSLKFWIVAVSDQSKEFGLA